MFATTLASGSRYHAYMQQIEQDEAMANLEEKEACHVYANIDTYYLEDFIQDFQDNHIDGMAYEALKEIFMLPESTVKLLPKTLQNIYAAMWKCADQWAKEQGKKQAQDYLENLAEEH